MPMEKPKSWGMLNSNKNNIMNYPCKEIGKSVPYFEELPKNNGTINEYLLSTIEEMQQQEMNIVKKNFYVVGVENLPDGGITIQASNSEKLKYKLQINDNRYF